MAMKVNALSQGFNWEDVTIAVRELTQETENLCSDKVIVIGRIQITGLPLMPSRCPKRLSGAHLGPVQ